MTKQNLLLFAIMILSLGAHTQTHNNNEYLVIEGNNIWVRSKPSTGEVVMKLNNGSKCTILSKGDIEIIRGVTDYWYEIKFENKTGWVFGSQCNQKLNNEQMAKLNDSLNRALVKAIKSIVKTLKEKDFKTLNQYLYPQSGMAVTYRPGIYPAYSFYSNIDTMFIDYQGKFALESLLLLNTENIKFENLPTFDCENFSKEGTFIEKIEEYTRLSTINSVIEQYILMEELPKEVKQNIASVEKRISRVLVSTGGQFELAFAYIGNQWYLMVIDFDKFDCSA